MSTRALLAVYENGKLKTTYFHHWDGYLGCLGNILKSFKEIITTRLNSRDNIPFNATRNQVAEIIKKRSGMDLLQRLIDIEGGFRKVTDFKEYYCLEYIYRINFNFDENASYSNWVVTLDYTTDISKVQKTWKPIKKFTPLIEYEGVHYFTESDCIICSELYGKVKPYKMPEKPQS